MLVLSRKPTERIRITGGIVITIVQIHGGKVSVGIEAPPDVRVLRDELPAEFETVVRSETVHSHKVETGHKATAFKPVPELVEA